MAMLRSSAVAALLILFAVLPGVSSPAPTLKGRGVWAGPRDAGMTEASVVAFVSQLEKAHVNTLVMEVKGGPGLYWPSNVHPDAVATGYREFDMPGLLIRECHKRGIQFHAWFFDFAEGADSWIVRQHPEWLARNAAGKPTTDEVLRGRSYGLAWMCPARRPGYTDQWLIPVISEFARRYDVDAIHHDYVRYPGDLAPDTYCFCDYCLAQLPRYASYYSQSYPDRAFLPPIDRPHLEAHWEKSPRVLPPNWDALPRDMKSRFLFEGSFFPGGHHDLDFFFYDYRIDAVLRFVREVAEAVHAVKPSVEFSAAVFKNPVQSARFIGQDWRRFHPWVQHAMPMDYRSHFPGDFETHLDLLAESVRQQKEWARDFKHLWIGLATQYLYDEEREPLVRIREFADGRGTLEGAKQQFALISERLRQFGPTLHDQIRGFLDSPSASTSPARPISEFMATPPAGYLPESKLRRTVERVRAEGAEGVVIFSAGGIGSARLWDTVADLYGRD
jgi:uncharacterized lipoprotein YddW (UPF0748 family)